MIRFYTKNGIICNTLKDVIYIKIKGAIRRGVPRELGSNEFEISDRKIPSLPFIKITLIKDCSVKFGKQVFFCKILNQNIAF